MWKGGNLTFSVSIFFFLMDPLAWQVNATHKNSTNFVKNKIATLITNISLDHQNILGSTLNDIAKDKAGAISENSLVISAPQKKSVENEKRKKIIKQLKFQKKKFFFFFFNDRTF